MHSRPDLRHPMMDTTGNLGRAKLLKGRARESSLIFTQVLESTLEGKKRPGIVTANWTIRRGEAERIQGNYVEARKDFLDAESTLKLYQNDRWLLLAISGLGELDLLTGRYQDALERFSEALVKAESGRNQFGVMACQYRLGLVDHIKGQFLEARAHYNLVLASNIRPVLYATYIKAAMVSLQLGDFDLATEQLSRGVQLCREILKGATDFFEVKAQFALGLLLKGHEAEAKALYGELAMFCRQHNLKGGIDAIMMDIALLEMLPDASRPDLEAMGMFYQVYSGKTKGLVRTDSVDSPQSPSKRLVYSSLSVVLVVATAALVFRLVRSR